MPAQAFPQRTLNTVHDGDCKITCQACAPGCNCPKEVHQEGEPLAKTDCTPEELNRGMQSSARVPPGKCLGPSVQGSLQETQPKDVQAQMDSFPLRHDERANEFQQVHKGLQANLCKAGAATVS